MNGLISIGNSLTEIIKQIFLCDSVEMKIEDENIYITINYSAKTRENNLFKLYNNFISEIDNPNNDVYSRKFLIDGLRIYNENFQSIIEKEKEMLSNSFGGNNCVVEIVYSEKFKELITTVAKYIN